jgi:hypothetical protein
MAKSNVNGSWNVAAYHRKLSAAAAPAA